MCLSKAVDNWNSPAYTLGELDEGDKVGGEAVSMVPFLLVYGRFSRPLPELQTGHLYLSREAWEQPPGCLDILWHPQSIYGGSNTGIDCLDIDTRLQVIMVCIVLAS